MAENFLTAWTPRLLSILRIMVGMLVLEHGTSKHLNFPASSRSGADALTLSGMSGVLELIGGFLIVLGLFARPVAFILSGLMATAYFIAHAPMGFFPLLNGGELAIVYCFVFLYIAAAGAGVWSVDYLRQQSTPG
jgi:putative oxidoreductase